MPTRAKYDSTSVTLSASTGFGGSFTVAYPTGRSAKDYLGGTDHQIFTNSHRPLSAANGEFRISLGSSNITVTVQTDVAFVSGEVIYLNLDRAEVDADSGSLANIDKMTAVEMVSIDLRSPATADADGVCASQSGTAATAMTIAGALATAGVATFDVPRNVVGAWTNTATLTVTGTDEYGQTLVETSGSGTSMTGKKAFKTITSVVPSANITSATVGSGVVLGLPVFLAATGEVVKEIMDGAAATAGTLVAGDTSTATATTGDVRGTYSPNSAPNGSRNFELIAALRSAAYLGADQYAG